MGYEEPGQPGVTRPGARPHASKIHRFKYTEHSGWGNRFPIGVGWLQNGAPPKKQHVLLTRKKKASHREKNTADLVTCCALQRCVHIPQLTKRLRERNWLVANWGQTDNTFCDRLLFVLTDSE